MRRKRVILSYTPLARKIIRMKAIYNAGKLGRLNASLDPINDRLGKIEQSEP